MNDYLVEDSMVRSAVHVTGPWRYERIEGAGHWMQLDRPDRINELLLEFLT
jgi:pimeloyl-ACP methyl ester carboxylesterase